MRGFLRWTFVLLLIVGTANAVQAQRPRGRMFGGPGFLLRNPAVQKELKLSDDQMSKLKDAMEKVRNDHKDEFAKLGQLAREDQQKLFRKVGEESRKAIDGILDAKQLKRFKQIAWQAGGAAALINPEVQKTLKLNDEQKSKLKDIFTASNKKMRELFQGGNVEGARDKFQAIRKETSEKANGVLSSEQKKAWKDMKGKPFEFPRPPQPKK